MYVIILTCAYTHGDWAHRQWVITTVLLGKTLTIFSCAPNGVWTLGLWISSPTLYQLSHPVTPRTDSVNQNCTFAINTLVPPWYSNNYHDPLSHCSSHAISYIFHLCDGKLIQNMPRAWNGNTVCTQVLWSAYKCIRIWWLELDVTSSAAYPSHKLRTRFGFWFF